jgi:hypothetical protein
MKAGTVTTSAENVGFVEMVGKNVKVSLVMSIDEFEKDIWANEYVRWRMAHCEFHDCMSCDGRYSLIAGKHEFGEECYECSSSETGKGFYCENCCKTHMTPKKDDGFHRWICNSCAEK